MLFGDIWKWAGIFRKTEKNIGINPIHISTQLRLLLDDVRFWIEHKTYSPIVNGDQNPRKSGDPSKYKSNLTNF
jgi:fido (protein-threonine AMPylation protein)